MKFVIQRVTEAAVTIDNQIKGKIDKGFLVLIGVGKEDTKEIADKYIKKLLGLRIFEDENGKTNLSLADVDGHPLRKLQKGQPPQLCGRRRTSGSRSPL